MAEAKNNSSSKKNKNDSDGQVSREELERQKKLTREITAVALGLVSVFTFICILAPQSAGMVGDSINYAFTFWFGWTRYMLPFLVMFMAFNFFFRKIRISIFWLLGAMVALYVDFSLFVELVNNDGGVVGEFIANNVVRVIGTAGAYLFSVGVGLILVMILTQLSLKQIASGFSAVFNLLGRAIKRGYHFLIIKPDESEKPELLNIPDLTPLEEGAEETGETSVPQPATASENLKTRSLETGVVSPSPAGSGNGKPTGYEKIHGSQDEVEAPPAMKYKLPPLDLLRSVEKDTEERSARDYSKLLEDTLADFGVEVKVINKVRGPTVTRYELQPAKGVKVRKVTNLSSDIALALAAYSIRIEAPIPGKSAIGIEVPNHRIDPVFLRDILTGAKYRKKPLLSLALGKDITGKPVMGDLLKMPHLLIAGATGSGKSVCLNCLVGSILYKADPTHVQMMMIDPKRVELSLFEGIPHLVDINLPGGKKIITDPKAATLALKTISEIMDKRYEDFVEMKVRNIKEYNQKAEKLLPYIVIIIDELADLMMVSSSTVEQYICRIAQLGRASGIHLIIATQRPSVDVITGLIKANIPSRIAFAVSSQVDSRTILDRVGAEKLLGKGDMLYSPVDASEPVRIQGAFVSGDEIEKVVEFWKQQPEPENAIPVEIEMDSGKKKEPATPEEERDELVPEAIEIIRSTRQASVSNLQRKMKVGYARAGRIMDQLEEMGIVGPPDGSKPRKILIPGVDDSSH